MSSMFQLLTAIVVATTVFGVCSHGHGHDHPEYEVVNSDGSQSSNGGVPSYAQCHAINETFSPVCPQNLGPPCPYCYTNWMSDYVNTETTDVTISQSMKLKIYDMIVKYANEILEYWPPSKTGYPTTDYAVFNGVAGLAQIFLRLYQHVDYVPNIKNQTATNDIKQIYLNYASEYLSYSLDLLPSFDKQEYVSYFSGNVGPWFLAAAYNQYTNDISKRDSYLKLINETFESVYQSITNNSTSKFAKVDLTDCTLDSGLAGLLYTGMLINAWFVNNNVTNSTYTWINVDYLKTIAYYMIKIGQTTGAANGNNYLQYEYPTGCFFIGQGHGSGGIVRMMLELARKYAPELLNDPNFVIPIANTMDYFVHVQYDDGNVACMNCTIWGFPTQADIKVQWCHGAPGFIDTYSKAASVFEKVNSTKSSIYLNAAYKASNATWQRGLLLKGLTYCHGIGGNAYMFLAFFNELRKMEEERLGLLLNNKMNVQLLDKKMDLRMIDVKNKHEFSEDIYFLKNQSAWRAKQYASWVLDASNLEMLHVASPASGMFQGDHGIVMFLSQMLQDGWPNDVQHCMPGWNSCV